MLDGGPDDPDPETPAPSATRRVARGVARPPADRAPVSAVWLDHLFVRPDATGGGVGSTLLDLVKSLRPDGFSLWVFESNTGARRFYRRHGLAELERTDGSANEEKSPDIKMAWPGSG
jgi:GNAT superfamily N-acetyltransferase